MMKYRVRYIGPIFHLKGHTALNQEENETHIAVQFDNLNARMIRPGPDVLGYEPHARFPTMVPGPDIQVELAYGKHWFPKEDFEDVYPGPD